MQTNATGKHSPKSFGGKLVASLATLLMLLAPVRAVADDGYIVKLGDYGKTLMLIAGDESTVDGENSWTLDNWVAIHGPYDLFQADFATTAVYVDKSFASARPDTIPYFFYNMMGLETIDGLENLCDANVTDVRGLFGCCSSLTSVDLSRLNTDNVTNMGGMFIGCKALTIDGLKGLNTLKTANVTDMSAMFCGCTALTTLDLRNFNTGKVYNLGFMFNACSSLKSIDVSSFNTDSVVDMSWMFGECSALTSLDLSSFTTTNVTNVSYMLYGCISLQELNIGSMDINSVAKNEMCFYGVGTPEEPCKLIVGSAFDQSVMGNPRTNAAGATYYKWLGGCFTAPVVNG